MSTFFDKVPRKFQDVSVIDQKIKAAEFLEASSGLVQLFDILGSTAFSPVKSDMNGNISKIRKFLDENTGVVTLQDMVELESKSKSNTATEALLWLKRALEFTALSIRYNVDNKSEELSASFNKGYESTLKKHHGMLVRPIFYVALKACPNRADFYKKLGDDLNTVMEQLEAWLKALEEILKILIEFYIQIGQEKAK
ncbi:Glycolipid transfer protein domain-containing protein [Rozella allomycis CSF55]|uniref:Glycolipid transfer protein domain-containing protein n=1 Tax=Rozella allomycis (strain CSF55) TaxID=988480 RepID=A0A075AMF2_ROZAC|nr:Glycolipid transfer protein domain-containing protein [Rozella allomycis CSF55]|eukprot:EPZ30794.1 Glycolipid transfer protein domain-containing protein [Rozella allomycis CSF55]